MALSNGSIADVLMGFEALHGCEFGVFQRCCEAEPLGLFRFAGSNISNLIRVLETDLEGFLTAEDVALEVRNREFMTFSRSNTDFYTHTEAFIHEDDEALILARETRKAAFLRARFLSDWRDGRRIYVHIGCEDEATILRLFAILRARSDCVLLWVVRAQAPEQRGCVDVQAPNLLKGYIAHYATFAKGPRLDLPGWAMVCRAADALVKGIPEVATIHSPLIARFRWARGFAGIVEASDVEGRCRILRTRACSAPGGQVTVTLASDVEEDELVVFSMWVFFDETFAVRSLVLMSNDATWVNSREADPDLLAEWQQVWLVMRVRVTGQPLRIDLSVEADAGSELAFGGWQIERGGIPNEAMRPRASPIRTGLLLQAEPMRDRSRARRIASVSLSALQRIVGEDSGVDASTGGSAFGLLSEADARMNAGLFEEADMILGVGKMLYPWRAELFSHHALCAEMSGHVLEAETRWAEMIRHFPQVAVGYYRLSAVLRKRGDIARAVDTIERALPDHRDDAALLVEAAQAFHAAGRTKDAITWRDAAIALGVSQSKWLDERDLAVDAAPSAVDTTIDIQSDTARLRRLGSIPSMSASADQTIGLA